MRKRISFIFALVFLLSVQNFETAFAQDTAAQPAIAFAARVVGDGNRARLIVDFNQPVTHDVYLLTDPRRIIVDLSQTVFSLDGEARRLPKSIVSDLRYGTIAAGKSRIVMQLAKPVLVENETLREIEAEKRHRLIVDLVATSSAEFAANARVIQQVTAAKPDKPEAQKSKTKAKEPSNRKFTIFVDAGHGGVDGGATGLDGTAEKRITLNFAKKLRTAMQVNPAFEVILSRDEDTFVALEDRVALARKAKADLLISVHADSLRQRDIRGATVYTLSEEGSDDLSNALARKQNRANLVAGLSLPKIETEVTDILIDLTRRETEKFSIKFASLIVQKMKNDIRLIRNPHRSADFFVLKAPEIPSVLLELGYLSNREDEQLMRSEDWQAKAVLRTKEAIESFFRARLAGQ